MSPRSSEPSRRVTDVLVAQLPHAEGLPLPSQATPGAAGYDVVSAEDGVLAPLERKLFRTGIAIAVPEGFEFRW